MIHPEKIELTLSRIFRLSIKIAFGTFYLIRIEKMLECYRQKRIKSIINNICFQFQYKLDLNTQLQRVSAMFEQEVSTSLQEACLSKKKWFQDLICYLFQNIYIQEGTIIVLMLKSLENLDSSLLYSQPMDFQLSDSKVTEPA